jgi:teichuronic acid biosynthesis glycosyltransferase TuaG
MPAYNAAETIVQAIDSVVAQTYPDWELIVVNDGSSDGTSELVRRKYGAESRIRLIDNDPNRGVACSRNIAIELSSGKYIAFLDCDDWWEPSKLQEQIALMETTGSKCCHSYYRRVSGDIGRALSVVRAPDRVTLQDMYFTNQIGNLTGIYHAGILGKFFQKEVRHEDYAMWLEILGTTDSICVPKVLANYRVKEGSLSGNKIQSLSWHFAILRNELNMSLTSAIYYTLAHVFTVVARRI